MNYNFIKSKLKTMVEGATVDEAALEFFISGEGNSFILNHNIDAIKSIFNFLATPENNIFILNGFMGSGKTYVADFILDFISDEVLIFRNSYQEAINPDDVLLSLFKDFSIYHNEKKIILPKVETNIFSEKINSYIKYCNSPMLFVFDSFEINMKSKDTQKDIIDFINFLSKFEKVKIIICSRSFKTYDLISSEGCVEYALSSLTRADAEEYLKQNGITGTNYEIDDIFKVTRGHYLLFELSVLIMQILGMSLTLFCNEYTKSTQNFLEFLLSKLLGTTADKFVKLLLFLSVIRHGVDGEFLFSQRIATPEDIDFLLQKKVIAEKFGKYYVKDYFKKEYIKTINAQSRIKAHEYIIELYQSELPLKPFERGLFLSRQTMRQEIAYHKTKIQELTEDLKKAGIARQIDTQGFNYLTYSKTTGFDTDMMNKRPSSIRTSGKLRRKKNSNLSDSDSLLLNISSVNNNLEKEIAEISNIHDTDIDKAINSPNVETQIPDSLDDYVKIAKNYENAFNYTNAILYYKKALTYKDDENFRNKEATVYEYMANCFRKIQDIDEAAKLFEKAYFLYTNIEPSMANDVLLKMAKMYSEAYKFEKAKEVYSRIIHSPFGVNSETIIRVYIDLSELEDNNMKSDLALKYIQTALKEAEKINNVKLLSECYFKYALLLDDTNNLDFAMKYYLRCIQVSNVPEENTYLSAAYSNLAEISLENKNISAAKMYFELSIEADKKQNNYEGLFHSYQKLARLYENEDKEKTYATLTNALSAAKRFDDIRYAITIYIEIGDFYLKNSEFKKALKSYILAKTLTPQHSEEELNNKINTKMNKMKSFLGSAEFDKLIEEIKKKR